MIGAREQLVLTGALLAAVALLLVWRLDADSAIAQADNPVYDVVHRALGPPAASPEITVVVVDDESLNRLGERWPLKRSTWARLAQALAEFKPRAVALDAWFEAPAARGEVELALTIADAIRDGPLGDSEDGATLANTLDKRAGLLDGDRQLATALADLGRVVSGVACVTGRTDVLARGLPGGLRPVPVTPPAGALPCDRLAGSIAPLASAVQSEASLAVRPDADGVMRRYSYLLRVGEKAYPTLALAMARLARPDADFTASITGVDEGRPGVRVAPTSAWRTLRFSDLLEVESSPALRDALQDRLVFVGVSALGTEDYIRTPQQREQAGVFLHAAATAALLEGRFVRYAGPWLGWGALLGFVLLLGVVAVEWRIERPSVVIALGLGAAALWGGAVALGLRAGHALPVLPVWGGILAWVALHLFQGYRKAADARRTARDIRRAFHQYLTPAVVDALVADPDQLKLGGERRNITAFFSDIKGFTNMSEALEPDALVAVLNECLGRMSQAIVDEGGVIDKYIGDAIVAMFGAPLPQPDHAARAVRAAVKCQAIMAELRAELLAQGMPELHVRIGLNTGDALVGNMGSAQRFDYTMIGDTVNQAARLEAINSHYGTWLCCSEATRAAAPDAAAYREMDLIRPKGKTVPVQIHEFAARAGTKWPAFASALGAYQAQDWDGALAGFEALANGGDGPSEAFVKRIRMYRERPPLDDWDGVFTMTTK